MFLLEIFKFQIANKFLKKKTKIEFDDFSEESYFIEGNLETSKGACGVPLQRGIINHQTRCKVIHQDLSMAKVKNYVYDVAVFLSYFLQSLEKYSTNFSRT